MDKNVFNNIFYEVWHDCLLPPEVLLNSSTLQESVSLINYDFFFLDT